MKIKKGDKVQIIKGKDRVRKTKKGEKMAKGNQGKVVSIIAEKNRLIVEGLNLRFKHLKPKKEGEKGQRIQIPSSIPFSNVMIVCPKCNKTTRVGFRLLNTDVKGKKKVRICRKCTEAID